MAKYQIPLEVLLTSNVSEFRADFQAELRRMEQDRLRAAQFNPKTGEQRTARGAATAAQRQTATLAGQTEARIEALRPEIGNKATDEALKAGRELVEQARVGLERGLQQVYGEQFRVPAPTQTLVNNARGRAAGVASAEADRLAQEAARRAASDEAGRAVSRVSGGVPLSREGLAAYRQHVRGPEGRDSAERIAETGVYDTELGRRSGVYREAMIQLDEETKGILTELHATRAALANYRETYESAAAEQEILNDLLNVENRDLADATGDLANARRRRQLAEQGISLEATEGLVGEEGRLRADRRRRNIAIEGAAAGEVTGADLTARAQLAREREAQAAQVRTQRDREAVTFDRSIEADAEALRARRDRTRAANEAAKRQDRESRRFGVPPDGSTFFQRTQARIAERRGGPPRDASEYQRLGQFLQARALTTAGFAISGAALYGGYTFISDVLRESEELQQQLAIVKSQIDNLEQSGQKVTFRQFREEIEDIATAAITTADQVTFVTRQLAGAFADEQGRPNFRKALDEGEVALQYSKLSGFPQQEITDSLTSIALAFGQDNDPLGFDRILDQATYLENRLGVLSQETIKYVAELAPLAAELGFTYEQLAGIGAVAQQSSGRTGTALAEQFGRILPFIQQNKAGILGLFAQQPDTREAIAPLTAEFGEGDIAGVLTEIIRYYDELDATQKNVLGDMLGGQRNAAALFAVLNRAPQALRALEEGPQGEGSFEQRMEEYRKTATFALATMRREAEELGNALYRAGIGEGLRDIAVAGQGLLKIVNLLVSGWSKIDETFGGFPGRAAVVLTMMKALQKAGAALAGTQVAQGFAARFGLPLTAATQPQLLSQIPPLGTRRLGYAAAGALPGQFGSPYAASGRQRFGVAVGQRVPGINRLFNRVTPAQAASSGGALTAGAVTAGTGTALAAGLTTAGVTIGALIAAQQVASFVEKRRQVKREVDAASEQAGDALEAAVANGLKGDDLVDVFEKSVEDSRLRQGSKPRARYGGSTERDKEFTRQVDLALLRDREQLYQDQFDVLQDYLKDRDGVANDAFERILQRDGDSGSNLDVDSELGRILLDSGAGYEGSYGNVEIRGDEDADKLIETIQKVRDYVLDNPDDENANQALQQLIDQVIESAGADSDVAEQIRELVGDFEENKERDAELNAIDTRLANLAETDAEFQAHISAIQTSINNRGVYTTGELLDIVRARKANSVAALDDARAAGNLTDRQLAELQAVVDEFESLERQAIQSQINQRESLATALLDVSGDPIGAAEGRLRAAQQSYQQVLDEGLGHRDRAEAAVKLVLAQQAAFNAALEAASPTEALRLLREGFEIDPQARRSIVQSATFDRKSTEDYLRRKESEAGAAAEARADAIEEELNSLPPPQRGDLKAEAEEERAAAIAENVADNRRGIVDEAIAIVDDVGKEAAIAYLEASLEQINKQLEEAAGRFGTEALLDAQARTQALLDAVRADPGGSGSTEDKNATELSENQNLRESRLKLRQSEIPDDPIARAEAELAAAEADLADIKRLTPEDEAAINEAQARVNDAKHEVSSAINDEARSLAEIMVERRRIQADGDPLREAEAAIESANIARQYAKTEVERQQAENDMLAALQQRRDAYADIAAAEGEYRAEALAGDPVAQARQIVANAERDVANAKGAAEQWRAMSARLQAQRELRAAILDAFIAQKEVAIAVAEGAGETVKTALIQLQVAQKRFNEAKAQGVKGAELDRLRADVIRQQNAVTTTVREDRLGDLEYLYEFDRLTATAYISLLRQELKKIPESNKEARRAIERRIKSLRDELSADLTTNLPSEIKLPILYEARRLNQVAQASNYTAQSYQDNRVGQVLIVVDGAGQPVDVGHAVYDAFLVGTSRTSPTGSTGIYP